MYLKEISTSGFKSFADKLQLSLDGKVTCIVGPNGSGKSNVVDAVRWVLGEQSVKSLRGDGSMTDVIFSGSKSRNPLNVASVELVFDNTDHFLNVPYTEISIKRKVYRSGENEYFINNERCRLKDINNLLLDSGMGKESYNIISQGEVDKILSNSSQDRRVIFEEASGILKYKKRKEEALRKLDRTHNNLDRVEDIIKELELQIGPLKEQSEKAKEYLENKKGLDKYEVALLAYDIENFNQDLETKVERKKKLEEEYLNLSSNSTTVDSKTLENSNKLAKLEEDQRKYQQELLQVTEEKEKIDSERKLLKERSKSTKEEEEIKEELRSLLEKKETLQGRKTIILDELNSTEEKINSFTDKTTNIEKSIDSLKAKRNLLASNYRTLNEEKIKNNNELRALETELEQGLDLPNSVRKVLNNHNLNGIYNTIGNVLQVEEKYVNALNTAIQANKNYVITKDEEAAKKAINYLKDNHLGRVTFFPMSVIKERSIDYETLGILKNSPEYIGIMSDLVTYNREYDKIIKNQLGTVIVSENLDSATRLSNKINRKYKIVTLEGDQVNIGGSLTGGSLYKGRSSILVKQEIDFIKKKIEAKEAEEKDLSLQITEADKTREQQEDSLFKLSKDKVELEEKQNSKNLELKEIDNQLESVNSEYESLQLINKNSVSDKEKELTTKYHEKSTYKEQLEVKLNNIREEISELKQIIENNQAEDKLLRSKLKQIEKETQEIEINISRLDVKVDTMLTTLSEEYELTFERAKKEYILDIEPDEARKKVNTYRTNIKRIGMVNLDSISEYEKVNTRYIYLNNQKEDLLNAEDTLLDIMNEMDDVMKEEFKTTFEQIQVEFQKVFKELFNGGTANLRLTNPDDLLTTGVDIIASPPGKKLTTISLLSGGEKTLTAISLLFAILNVRKVPFCLFDEVEAALDEANVSQFGKYLSNYRDKTQFLIITHKKKTMEYANTLYGITMQESGVSKLVSVKLENHQEVI